MEFDDTEQQKIIELRDTTSLVLAGPGCGKTHILARRVFHASAYVDFKRMLCVTFTNRAAREMKDRIAGYMGYIPPELFVGNMHRFCLNFLYANELLGADTTVLDEEDQLEILETILDNPSPHDITDFLTKTAYIYQKDHDHPDWIIRHPSTPFSEKDYDALDAYMKFKADNRLVDFDDILLQAYTALQQKPLTDFVMADYEWVQVDEVQDMTPLQLAIVDCLTKKYRRTLVYFGDEQQAIFRFLGAGGRALEVLKHQCRGNIHRLRRNYRSPGYLVEMCNTLAMDWLGIDRDFLPEAIDNPPEAGNMTIYQGNAEEITYTAANLCRRRLAESPGETVAVLCRTNKDADMISDVFESLGIRHFHVPKKDIFHRTPFKTVWAHLAAVSQPYLIHPWARLLYQTGCVTTLTGARNLVRLLRDSGIGCDELLDFDRPLRIERLAELIASDTDIVVFDTETTGLDVAGDDVVQIAAVKLRGGEIVDRFEVFVRTDKRLPRELAPGVENPIVEAYRAAKKQSPEEAFESFRRFIHGCVLAGHNIGFDTAMMRSNISRRTSADIPWELMPMAETVDTLVLARQFFPKANSHRLGDMLAMLELEGNNSHNAIDDAAATATLLLALARKVKDIEPDIRRVRDNRRIRRCAERFATRYGQFYRKWKSKLHDTSEADDNTLCAAISDANEFMTMHDYTAGIDKLGYVLALIDRCVIDADEPRRFGAQVARHLFDLLAFNEADLFSNGIIEERLSIMTVHKAKGLEMDNVVVYDASKFFGTVEDHARLLYVAFSRARKRLAVGVGYKMPIPMRGLHHYFRRLTPNQVRLAVNCEFLNRR